MEQVKDMEMKGVSTVDENQYEVETACTVKCSEPKNVIETSQDEEFHDASSCSTDDTSSDDDSTDDDYEHSDVEDVPSNLKYCYKVLRYDELQQCQEDDILNVSNALSVSRVEATILLLHYHWNVQTVTEKWLANANGVREELCLPEIFAERPSSSVTNEVTCGKCSQTIPGYLGSDAFCSHKFCNTCWKDIIEASLKNFCLILRCPAESCNAPVNPDFIRMLASKSDQRLYSANFMKSYLTDDTKGKWCPTPGCNHAVLLEPGRTISKFVCKCFSSICYKCLNEAHQPASCAIAERWRKEHLKQSRNWNISCICNCPKCHRPLVAKTWHKRVECTSCSFHFCRACFGSWLEHGLWEGDHYTHICIEAKLIEFAKDAKNWANATCALARYEEYVSQYKRLEKEQYEVLMRLRTMMQNGELKVLADKQGLQLSEVAFVTETWLQAAECKRVLKWACAFDYYLFLLQGDMSFLFGDLIKKAAYVMDQLHTCAGELWRFISTDVPTDEFENFRGRLYIKTRVARNFFDNVEIAIQQRITDIDCLRQIICWRESIEQKKPLIDVGTSSSPTEPVDEPSEWACPHCTFSNDNSTAVCCMCYH